MKRMLSFFWNIIPAKQITKKFNGNIVENLINREFLLKSMGKLKTQALN
jgi:hypothetical protein